MNPKLEVEEQWEWLLHRKDLSPEVRALVRAASDRVELRRLFPFISLHRRLRFSALTREPYEWHYPYVLHADAAEYEARGGDGRPLVRSGLDDALNAAIQVLPEPPEEVRSRVDGT
jgi:hypothetical protein